MVEWTDQERSVITSIFGNLDYDDIGPKALCRYGERLLFERTRNEIKRKKL